MKQFGHGTVRRFCSERSSISCITGIMNATMATPRCLGTSGLEPTTTDHRTRPAAPATASGKCTVRPQSCLVSRGTLENKIRVETPAQQVSVDLGSFNVYGDKVPQSVNSTSDPCCTRHEWLVFPPGGSTEFFAGAAFSTLRAHAAGKPNSHFGRIADVRCGLDRGLLCGQSYLDQRLLNDRFSSWDKQGHGSTFT